MARKSTRREWIRKGIHVGGVSTIWVNLFIGKQALILLIAAVSGAYIVSEYLRINGKTMPLIKEITLSAAREGETSHFVKAPLYYACGIVLSLTLFPDTISNVSIAVLTLGDPAASIAGRMLGRTPLPYNSLKTLEGLLGGFFLAFLSSSLFVHPLMALLGSAVGMSIESVNTPVNDNLLIPVAVGLCLLLSTIYL